MNTITLLILLLFCAVGILVAILFVRNTSSYHSYQSGATNKPLTFNVIHVSNVHGERKTHMEKAFSKCPNIKLLFHEAITPSSPEHKLFSANNYSKLVHPKNRTSPKEVACSLSHLKVACNGETAHPSLMDWIIIAEDDLEPATNISSETIHGVVWNALTYAPKSVKFIMFSRSGGARIFATTRTREVSVVNKHVNFFNPTFIHGIANGSMCYAIRRSFASDVFSKNYNRANTILPYDIFYREFFNQHKSKHISLLINRFSHKTYYEGMGLFLTSGKLDSTLDADREQSTIKLWAEYFAANPLSEVFPDDTKSHKQTWKKMCAIGKEHGVIINTWVPSGIRVDLFYDPMVHNWQKWCEQAGLPKPTICDESPSTSSKREGLVIALGSFWPTSTLPKWFIGLMSETLQIDTLVVQEAQRTHREMYGDDGGYFGISFSPAIAALLRQPHAYWIWHEPNTGKNKAIIPESDWHKPNQNVFVWMSLTKHRSNVLRELRNHKFHVYESNVNGKSGTKNRCKDLDYAHSVGSVFLNLHQKNYKHEFVHMEVHRLTHPCIQGKCVVSEKSSDPLAEKALMDAGLLHAVWDGRPDTLESTIIIARKRWRNQQENGISKYNPTLYWMI